MGMTGPSKPGAQVRHREVTWEDPLVSAAQALDLSGLDFLRGIIAGRIPPPPIAVLFGMSILAAEPGQVTFGLDVGEHLYNPIGSVHGGIFCTLLDSAMGCAVHSSLALGRAYTTLELKVNLVKALTVRTPTVVAEGLVVTSSRRVATASGPSGCGGNAAPPPSYSSCGPPSLPPPPTPITWPTSTNSPLPIPSASWWIPISIGVRTWCASPPNCSAAASPTSTCPASTPATIPASVSPPGTLSSPTSPSPDGSPLARPC